MHLSEQDCVFKTGRDNFVVDLRNLDLGFDSAYLTVLSLFLGLAWSYLGAC